MSRNPVLYKSLVVGVIVLFVGVGIQPALAVDVSTSISDDEDDCNLCPKVSNQHIEQLKNVINKIEEYKDIIPIVSKFNPKVGEKYREISDIIIVLKEVEYKSKSNMPYVGSSVICAGLLVALLGASAVLGVFVTIMEKFGKGSLVWIIFTPPAFVILTIIAGAFVLYGILDCLDIPR